MFFLSVTDKCQFEVKNRLASIEGDEVMLCNACSFSTVLHNEIQRIQNTRPDILIELPCVDSPALDNMINTCKKTNHPYALHYPSFDSFNRVGFTADADSNRIIDDIRRFYCQYNDAEYFVCHFPFHSISTACMAPEELLKTILCLESMQGNGNTLVIENTSVVDNCKTASDYYDYLSKTTLGLCLDIGHAFLSGSDEEKLFFKMFADRIRVIHYYNTSFNGINKGKHLSPFKYRKSHSTMNLDDIDELIRSLPNLKWLVNESNEE